MVMKELNMANGEWLTVTADTSPSLSLSLSPVTKVRMIFLVSQLILIDQRGRVGKATHRQHRRLAYLSLPLLLSNDAIAAGYYYYYYRYHSPYH